MNPVGNQHFHCKNVFLGVKLTTKSAINSSICKVVMIMWRFFLWWFLFVCFLNCNFVESTSPKGAFAEMSFQQVEGLSDGSNEYNVGTVFIYQFPICTDICCVRWEISMQHADIHTCTYIYIIIISIIFVIFKIIIYICIHVWTYYIYI